MEQLARLAELPIGNVPANLLTLFGVVVVFLGFWIVGRSLGASSIWASVLTGWAATYAGILALGLMGVPDMRLIVPLILGVSAWGLLSGRLKHPPTDLWPAVLPAIPLGLLALAMPLLHWDSYSHWVLNASYLFRFDRLVASPLDGFSSWHPWYPVAMPVVTYLASLSSGRFAETAGSFTNVTLTVLATACVMTLMRDVTHRVQLTSKDERATAVVVSILSFCIVASFYPGFRAVYYFSATADPALGVIVLCAVTYWSSATCTARCPADESGRAQPARPGERPVQRLAVLFLFGCLLVGVKSSGWLLALVLAASGAMTGMFARTSWRRWLAPAVALSLGAVLAQIAWQSYVSTHIGLADEFRVRPLDEWRIDLAPALMRAIWADLNTFSAYYALVGVTTAAGLVILLKSGRGPATRVSNALALIAVAVPIYLAAVTLSYLGSGFNEAEIVRAASLQRYTSHVGFPACALGMVAAASAVLPRLVGWIGQARPHVVYLACLTVYATALLATIAMPALRQASDDSRRNDPLRVAAASVSGDLRPDQTVAVIGSPWALNLARYELWKPYADDKAATLVAYYSGPLGRNADASGLEHARRWYEDRRSQPSVDVIWLIDVPALARVVAGHDAGNVVWIRKDDAWRVYE